MESIALTDADRNAGHITIVRVDSAWHVAFDFRYNAERIGQVLETAREFLDAASYATERGQFHAAIDNLFSAVELLARGRLLMLPDPKILHAKSHGFHAKYHEFGGKLGNVDRRFVKLLKDLARLHVAARYPPPPRPLAVDLTRARHLLATAEAMFSDLKAQLPERPPE